MAAQGLKGVCQCLCGRVRIRLEKPAMTRFYCHCAICQEVYGADFGDPTVAWAFHVQVEDVSEIEFKRQRFIPISVSCGTCKSCKHPVVGYTTLLPFLKIAFVPAYMYSDQADVPESVGHIFYRSRTSDVADELPKYSGFLASEWAVTRFILAGIIGS